MLRKENITEDEKEKIIDKMITVADKMAAKDTENKDFLKEIIHAGIPIIGGVLLLGAAILGVNVKGGGKLPTLKK